MDLIVKQDEVKARRAESGCSLFEAKRQVLKGKLLKAISETTDVKDMRQILEVIVRETL